MKNIIMLDRKKKIQFEKRSPYKAIKMTEEELRARIDELELELEKKEHEIIQCLERIELLEETIMRLELLVPDQKSNKKRKKSKDSKSAILIEEKEKEIRDLKDKMGFLRKEKVQLQQEVEKLTKDKSSSTVIRIEEKQQPLETLIKELQEKINKQNYLIKDLQSQLIDNTSTLATNHNDGLKKCVDFKNDIINELINLIQSKELLLSDEIVQSKLQSLQEYNKKLDTQITKF